VLSPEREPDRSMAQFVSPGRESEDREVTLRRGYRDAGVASLRKLDVHCGSDKRDYLRTHYSRCDGAAAGLCEHVGSEQPQNGKECDAFIHTCFFRQSYT